jgi:hypothetical protein
MLFLVRKDQGNEIESLFDQLGIDKTRIAAWHDAR